jgi:phosphoribosyl-AMP cyclohydrolase
LELARGRVGRARSAVAITGMVGTFPLRLQRTKMPAMSEQDILAAIRFDAGGLVPAIAQQHDTGEVLMLAWMNRDAVAETLATGRVCYFSRSRNRLWRKGEQSGQVQHLKELRIDCDGDTLLLLVDQQGVACHTGRRNCFFRAARGGALVEIAAPLVAPETLYG